MALSILPASKTLLMVSDDALFIYSVSGRSVKLVEAVPWTAENFEDNVSVIISKECGGKPVLIVNDMVEQHYRKEKIPNVSVLDKSSIIKRKLEVAFPNYPVRAALPLKEKMDKTKDSLGANVCLFAAVPATEAFTKTMSSAVKSLAPIAGFCLLPIEASDMIKKLSDKMVPKADQGAKWTVFMGQHQGGGLRQIVTKNGELALTRMTPIVDNDNDPVLWANEVYQEFQATMSYLSRFGFDHNDGINVILVADDATGDIVSELIKEECGFYAITAEDALKKLGLPSINQDTSYHADGIHAAWIGKKSKYILPMRAHQIDNVSKPRRIANILSIGLLLGAAFLGYQLFTNARALSVATSDIEDAQKAQNQIQLQLDKEIQRKKDLGFDIQLIQVSLDAHKQFDERHIDYFGLFEAVGKALGPQMRVDRIDVSRGKKISPRDLLNLSKNAPKFYSTMQMTFPSKTDAQKGNQEVRDLQNRLQALLPDHVVEITKLLEDYEYTEALVVESRDAISKSKDQDYIAELSIEGPRIKND